MPHEIQDPSAWKRLGKLLIARRVALGWLERTAFVKYHENRLRNGRTVEAIENNERMNFGPSMLSLIEILYEWTPGSIDHVLAGGDPTPIEDDVKVVHETPPATTDRMECHILIEKLREDQLPEARRVLSDLYATER